MDPIAGVAAASAGGFAQTGGLCTAQDPALSADRRLAWPSAHLPGWLRPPAARAGDAALVSGGVRLSHGDLHAAVQALAARLVAQGIRPGDRVALLLDNRIECAVAILACLRCGAVFVPLNPRMRPDKLRFLLRDCDASLLLTQASALEAWQPAIGACSGLRAAWVCGYEDLATADRADGIEPWPEPGRFDASGLPCERSFAGDALAAILYTSGSTGFPKGVMLSRGNIGHAAESIQSYLGLRADDVVACPLPLSHTYGLYQLLIGLAVGASVVLDRHARLPVALLTDWAAAGVSVLPVTPMLLGLLLPHASSAAAALPRLRLVTTAAEALAPARDRAVRQAWPHADILAMYGLTECARVSYLPHGEAERRAGSVGRGMPGSEHWLVDELGRRLPPGATGELVVRGPHVMQGYWQRPEETAERLRPADDGSGDRVLFTGDLFRTDGDGWLYFVGRRDEMIKTRGEKVSPREVERAIQDLDGVREVAVAGEPDPLLGQAIVAWVVCQPGVALTARDVQRQCRAQLEPHLVPQAVKFVPELPKTESGKLRRAALTETPSVAAERGTPQEPAGPPRGRLPEDEARRYTREH